MNKNKQYTSDHATEINTVQRQSIDWFQYMQGDHIDENKRREFDAWLAESSEHREAYLEAEILSDTLTYLADTKEGQQIRESVEMASLNLTKDADRNPIWKKIGFVMNEMLSSKTVYAGAFAIMLCLIAVTLWLSNVTTTQPDRIELQQRFISERGHMRNVLLSDGTRVTLGPQSEILVVPEAIRRSVKLIRGEAFFDVAKDPSRPFYVEEDEISIKVVGTRFDVRKRPSYTSIGVVEGVVQVFTSHPEDPDRMKLDEPLLLTAGQQVYAGDDLELMPNSTLQLSDIASWREGRLIYNNAELQDVLADANRYNNAGKILIEGDTLMRKQITLSINASQIKDLPQMLAKLLPVEVKRLSGDIILMQN